MQLVILKQVCKTEIPLAPEGKKPKYLNTAWMLLWNHCNTYLPCSCLLSSWWFTVAISRSSGLKSIEIPGSANFFAKQNQWADFSTAPFPPVWDSNSDFCLVKQWHVIYSLQPVCFTSLLEVLGIIFTGCQSLFLSVIHSRINVKGSQSRSHSFPRRSQTAERLGASPVF